MPTLWAIKYYRVVVFMKHGVEFKNEIAIVGEYKYKRQRVCEHRHVFPLNQNDNSHTLK